MTDEERIELLTNSRSIERLLKWARCFVRIDDGLQCLYCGSSLLYDFKNGESFTENDIMPRSFRNLKTDIKRHMQSNKHITNSQTYFREKKESEEMENAGKLNALNCANAAYFIYKKNLSYESYEDLVCIMHNSGCDIGTKNHSKEFPRLYLPHVHSVLLKEIATFITSADLPVGIVADKITVNHRSRHIVGLRIPIFDVNARNLFHSIYLEHNFVNDFSGKGLSSSILNTLDKFGLDAQYVREHLAGLAVDGQYIKLGVADHIKTELNLKNVLASWDIMHRIELMEKNSEMPNILNKAYNLILECMKEFNYGLKYESLVNISQDFQEFLYRPKLFKTMKFASYSMEVFTTFIHDYKFFVSACEKDMDLFTLRDKLLNKTTLFHILLLADLYNIISKFSKCVQSAEILPWDYLRNLNNFHSHLEIFLNYVSEMSHLTTIDDLCNFLEKIPNAFFAHSKTALEMFQFCTYQGVPLPDKPISAKILRSSVSATYHEENENQLTATYKNDLKDFIKFITCILEKFTYYTKGKNQCNDEIIKKVECLFSFDHLIFPRSDISGAHSSSTFTSETFSNYISDFPFIVANVDKDTLFFEYKRLCSFIEDKIAESRDEGLLCDIRKLFKVAMLQLKNKFPLILKFFMFAISIPVSEAICESWGSVIANVMLKRPRGDDGFLEDIGTSDMRVFIMLNGPESGFKNIRKFLKTALVEKYGMSYFQHFKHVSTKVAFKQSVTSKVVSRIINDSDGCLPCFQ